MMRMILVVAVTSEFVFSRLTAVWTSPAFSGCSGWVGTNYEPPVVCRKAIVSGFSGWPRLQIERLIFQLKSYNRKTQGPLSRRIIEVEE
jgi:hypothetical protein